jgi:hypothetical protein
VDFERFGARHENSPAGSRPSRIVLRFRLDRHDLVACPALVDVDERAQPDPGQLSQSRGIASAGFAARRRGFFLERSGHGAESLTLATEQAARMLTDCILIMEN